jgi:hypothetical protein
MVFPYKDGPTTRREALEEMKGTGEFAGPAAVTSLWISDNSAHGNCIIPGDFFGKKKHI